MLASDEYLLLDRLNQVLDNHFAFGYRSEGREQLWRQAEKSTVPTIRISGRVAMMGIFWGRPDIRDALFNEEVLDDSRRLFDQIEPDLVRVGRIRFLFHYFVQQYRYFQGRYYDALIEAAKAYELGQSSEDPIIQARTICMFGQSLFVLGHTDEAYATQRLTVDLIDSAPVSQQDFVLISLVADYAEWSERPDLALLHWQQAFHRCAPEPANTLKILAGIVKNLTRLGQLDVAEDSLASLRRAQPNGNPVAMTKAAIAESSWLRATAQCQDALDVIGEALTLVDPADLTPLTAELLIERGAILAQSKSWDAVVDNAKHTLTFPVYTWHQCQFDLQRALATWSKGGPNSCDFSVAAEISQARAFQRRRIQPSGLCPVAGLHSMAEAEAGARVGAETIEQRISTYRSDFHTGTISVAHDIRSPLTALSMLASTPADGHLRDSAITMARQVVDSLKRFRHNNDNEHESIHKDAAHVELSSLLHSVAGAVSASAKSKDIELIVRAPENLHATIDEESFFRSVGNLVDNAIKFTPAGGSVIVSCEAFGPQWVSVEVRDTGPGIPPTDLERIFEWGVMGEHLATAGEQQSGFGLAIARHLIRSVHGEIQAFDQGDGAVFAIRLMRYFPPEWAFQAGSVDWSNPREVGGMLRSTTSKSVDSVPVRTRADFLEAARPGKRPLGSCRPQRPIPVRRQAAASTGMDRAAQAFTAFYQGRWMEATDWAQAGLKDLGTGPEVTNDLIVLAGRILLEADLAQEAVSLLSGQDYRHLGVDRAQHAAWLVRAGLVAGDAGAVSSGLERLEQCKGSLADAYRDLLDGHRRIDHQLEVPGGGMTGGASLGPRLRRAAGTFAQLGLVDETANTAAVAVLLADTDHRLQTAADQLAGVVDPADWPLCTFDLKLRLLDSSLDDLGVGSVVGRLGQDVFDVLLTPVPAPFLGELWRTATDPAPVRQAIAERGRAADRLAALLERTHPAIDHAIARSHQILDCLADPTIGHGDQDQLMTELANLFDQLPALDLGCDPT